MACRREASSRAPPSARADVGYRHGWEPFDEQEGSLPAPGAPGDILPGEAPQHRRPGFRRLGSLPLRGSRGWVEKLAHLAELLAAHGVGQEPVMRDPYEAAGQHVQ